MKTVKKEEYIFYSPGGIVEAIMRGETPERDNIYNVISNPARQEIIKFCYNQPKTITEIQKHLRLSYSPTWKHVQQLLDKGLVTGTPTVDKEKGAVMLIKSVRGEILKGKRIK